MPKNAHPYNKPADHTARIVTMSSDLDERHADRMRLLDRIAERVPELDTATTCTRTGRWTRSSQATSAAS
jgi:hypothetical protein